MPPSRFMNFNFSCISSRILLDLPHQIWEAQSFDPAGQIFLTRLFHNKILFLLNNYLRCYLSYFSPEFITNAFTVIGLGFFLLGLYYVITKRQWVILATLLTAPIFPLFEIPSTVVIRGAAIYLAIILVMGYGIWSLVKKAEAR